MPTFEEPAADAEEAQTALRALAHATRSIDDPADIYPALGSLSMAATSLEQSLHQLAAFHDRPGARHALVEGDPKAGQAAAYQVSWELHRAGAIAHQIAAAIDRAHEVEAQIDYVHGTPPVRPEPRPPARVPSPELSL